MFGIIEKLGALRMGGEGEGGDSGGTPSPRPTPTPAPRPVENDEPIG